jgi:hypothetical protein
MGQRVHRRSNDGNYTGIKQDKFRNSAFEYEDNNPRQYEGVSRATSNTINGKWAENRGRRGDDNSRFDNPFENGKLHNWNRRQGWDEYYEPRHREDRPHGGAHLHHDFGDLQGSHQGRGPRGYVRQDSRIHDDVCELLTRDRELDAGQVDVSVQDGVVTLTGKVDDRDMKRYAGNIIDRIPGVRDIHNLLEFDRR